MLLNVASPLSQTAVVIVTHNSQAYLPKCLEALSCQTCPPKELLIVDSGSKDCSYLKELPYGPVEALQLIYSKENIGFCRANNLAWQHIAADTKYVLFLNPDAFLSPTYIEQAQLILSERQYMHYAALTGTLLGYNIETLSLTGFYDSRGIFQTWWGKWYDRDRGKQCIAHKMQKEDLPAICGAAFFARQSALKTAALSHGELFDNNYFMYKEDIELSLRLKRHGWHLLYSPGLYAYHCRGWNNSRRQNSLLSRKLSAQNELRLHRQYGTWIHKIYSMAKLLGVKHFNL